MGFSGPAVPTGSASMPHSEAVTNDLQELSLQHAPNLLPIHERKNGEVILIYNIYIIMLNMEVCHDVKNRNFAS